MANFATQYLYAWLLRNNVEIYEWRQSVVHGKVAVVDNHWVTVGSFNLNHLSALESIELNYIFNDKPVASVALHELQQIIEHECDYVAPEKFVESHTVFRQLREWFAYRFYRVSLRVLLLFGASWKYVPQRRRAIEG
jgi:cardiolipin synthase